MAVTLTNLPKVKSITQSIEPLWASDAGRNSNSGKYSGTFVGWFDKIEVSIGKCNQSELTTIKSAIESPIIESVTFPDDKTGTNMTEDFYGTAIETELNNMHQIYEPFKFKLVAVAKRSDM